MNDSPDHDEPPRRGAMVALLVVIALILGGLYVSHVLRNVSQTEDCLMQGRRNCAPVR
jgi:hypothetical protein